MPGARLTAKQWAEARRLRDDLSLSNEEIAVRLGVHSRTIEKRALRDGCPPIPTRLLLSPTPSGGATR